MDPGISVPPVVLRNNGHPSLRAFTCVMNDYDRPLTRTDDQRERTAILLVMRSSGCPLWTPLCPRAVSAAERMTSVRARTCRPDRVRTPDHLPPAPSASANHSLSFLKNFYIKVTSYSIPKCCISSSGFVRSSAEMCLFAIAVFSSLSGAWPYFFLSFTCSVKFTSLSRSCSFPSNCWTSPN